MKPSTTSLGFLTLLIGFSVHAGDLKTKAIALEWDHWLWMKRISVQDPTWTPDGFDPTDREIRMFERKSAKEIYEACGIKIQDGESFFYGATTTQMIVRLDPENLRRVHQIHKTIRDWKSGKTAQWHLDWITRSEANANSQYGANKPAMASLIPLRVD